MVRWHSKGRFPKPGDGPGRLVAARLSSRRGFLLPEVPSRFQNPVFWLSSWLLVSVAGERRLRNRCMDYHRRITLSPPLAQTRLSKGLLSSETWPCPPCGYEMDPAAGYHAWQAVRRPKALAIRL